MSKTIYTVKLTETEISYLESILHQPTSEARHYIRCCNFLQQWFCTFGNGYSDTHLIKNKWQQAT